MADDRRLTNMSLEQKKSFFETVFGIQEPTKRQQMLLNSKLMMGLGLTRIDFKKHEKSLEDACTTLLGRQLMVVERNWKLLENLILVIM